MGIGLGFEQAPPRHDGVRVVPAAVAVLHGVFLQGGDVGLEGGFHPGPGGEFHAPGLGKCDALGGTGQVQEGLDPAGLGHDLALQAAAVLGGRDKIALGVLLELGEALLPFRCHGLHLERNGRVKGTDEHVLRIGQIAAPVGHFRREVFIIQELHGRTQVGHFKAVVAEFREPVQDDGRDDGRRSHSLEPAEAAVGVAAGEDLFQEGMRFLRFARNDSAIVIPNLRSK